MSLLITNDCISCDACIPECPNDAIKKGAGINTVDAENCTECVGHYKEPQCVAVCPTQCIIKNPKIRETKEELKSKFMRLQLMKK